MNKKKDFLNDNCNDNYLLHNSIFFDEETKSESQSNNNHYFEISSDDMKLSKDFNTLFEDEKDSHNNQFTKEQTVLNSKAIFSELAYIISLPIYIFKYIPPVRLLLNYYGCDLYEENMEMKQFSIKLVTLFLIVMNLWIYFFIIDKRWKLFLLLVNNIYLIMFIEMIVIKTKNVLIKEGII